MDLPDRRKWIFYVAAAKARCWKDYAEPLMKRAHGTALTVFKLAMPPLRAELMRGHLASDARHQLAVELLQHPLHLVW